MERSTALELMDEPERVSREEMVGALEGLRRVNRLLGGRALLLRAITPMLEKARGITRGPIRICDIGCGAGDLPIAMAEFARSRGMDVEIVAVELNADLAAEARRCCGRWREINVVTADAREVLSGGGFDIATASLFLHHFPPTEVRAWMVLMQSATRVGWIVNDLERHVLAWIGIRVVGPLMCRNAVFRNDAPLSVRRSYTPGEWQDLALDAGAPGARVTRHWPWRVIVRGVHEREGIE